MDAMDGDSTILDVLCSADMASVEVRPILLVAATGELPEACWPMPRDPLPALGWPFDRTFPARFCAALAQNPAVHDGAVLLLRDRDADAYSVAGWSLRLGASPRLQPVARNRGSAYNSAAATSETKGVDAVYLLTREGLIVFRNGRPSELQ